MESIKSVKIYLNNADEVWKFVNIIRKFSGDYDLAAGSYTVDAKSILGVCALGTKKPLELKLVDPRGEEKSLLTALDPYLRRECTSAAVRAYPKGSYLLNVWKFFFYLAGIIMKTVQRKSFFINREV